MKYKLLCLVMLFVFPVVSALSTEGLMSYWQFNEERNDTHDGLANWTNSGSNFKKGILGNGLYFDGVNDYTIADDNVAYDSLTTQITLNLWINTSTIDREGIFFMADNNEPLDSGPFILESRSGADAGKLRITFGLDTGNGQGLTNVTDWNNGSFHMATFVWSADTDILEIYEDGVWKQNISIVGNNLINLNSKMFLGCLADNDACAAGFYFNGTVDEISLWNRTLDANEISKLYNGGATLAYPFVPFDAPVLSDYNCTSCNPPHGDTVSPYSTDDTTPTFTFVTNVSANCRMSQYDYNYTYMTASRDCSTTGGKTHVCTLAAIDNLTNIPTDYVYFGCENMAKVENTTSSSGAIEINLSVLDDAPQINNITFNQSSYFSTDNIMLIFNVTDNNTIQDINITIVWSVDSVNTFNHTLTDVSQGIYNRTFDYSNYKSLNNVSYVMIVNNSLGATTTNETIVNMTFAVTLCTNVTGFEFLPNLTSAIITINTTLNATTGNKTTKYFITSYNNTIINQSDELCVVKILNLNTLGANLSMGMLINESSATHNISCNPSNNDIDVSPFVILNTTIQTVLNIPAGDELYISCWGDFIMANTTFDFNVTINES